MVRGWLFDTTICRKKWSSDMSISKKANDWSSGIICIADGCLVGIVAKKRRLYDLLGSLPPSPPILANNRSNVVIFIFFANSFVDCSLCSCLQISAQGN